jgi:hypothetical protein
MKANVKPVVVEAYSPGHSSPTHNAGLASRSFGAPPLPSTPLE